MANRLIDNLFRDLEQKGLRAIAMSSEENVRTELLAMMQTLSNYKIKIHKEIQDAPVDKVLLTEGEELTEEIISELGPASEIIKIEKNDDNN